MRSIMKIVLVLAGAAILCLVIVSGQDDNQDNNNQDFRMRLYRIYMSLHNRSWVEEDLPKRLELYWTRRLKVMESIKNFESGKSDYALAENDFMDMSDEERAQFKSGGLSIPSDEELERERAEDEATQREEEQQQQRGQQQQMMGSNAPGDTPTNFDWRRMGCIPPAFHQGRCGSCYAAATRAAIEGMRCVRQGSTPELSHQQIVDCATQSTGYNNNGCDGGWPHESLKYLQDVSYIAKASSYPQTGRQDRCRVTNMNLSNFVRASPNDQEKIKYKNLYNEESMKTAVAQIGPVINFVQVSDDFMDYGRGIFDGHDCSTKFRDTDHVVVAMGYGTENGKDYWLLKNSYGRNWGEDGYMRLRRGTGACGIGHLAHVITA